MPKTKNKPNKNFEMKFTGKMTALIELEDFGPLEFRVNDLDVVMKIVRLLLEEQDNVMSFGAYTKRTETKYRKILDDIT